MPKVLLVEDNELNRDMLRRRLRHRGYSVITANDGEKGIDLAVKERPDIILMDLDLPVVDGWQATREIKAQTQAIPIIALTAHAMAEDRATAMAAGCDDYDTKPIVFRRLIHKIDALLETAPANEAAPHDLSRDHGSAEQSHSVGRLLVVDDNENNRELLRLKLVRQGYQVVTAPDGETALSIIERETISLVLLDLMMPGIDGLETLRRLRKRHNRPSLPVIMVTAESDFGAMVEAFALGANDYITKPVNLGAALTLIQTHLTLSDSRGEVGPGQSEAPGAPPAAAPASQPEAPPQSDTDRLRSRYQIDRLISEHSFGEQHLAEDLRTSADTPVVVHSFNLPVEDTGLEGNVRRCLESEISALSRLALKDNIVPCLDSFEQSGRFHWVRPYIDGCCLEQQLRPGSRLPLAEVLQLVAELLAMLQPFHQQGIIHGDFHPKHLIRRAQDQRLMLVEYGLVKRMFVQLKSQSLLYRQAILCQRQYRPIEQRLGSPQLSSDLYTVGLIGLQALTGQSPEQLTPVSRYTINSLVTEADEVIDFFTTLVNPNARLRYGSADEALEALPALSPLCSQPLDSHAPRAYADLLADRIS